jgi:hypothetical protein
MTTVQIAKNVVQMGVAIDAQMFENTFLNSNLILSK